MTLSVKVTPGEKEELERQYGSAYAGLRFAVERLLGKVVEPVRIEPTASAGGEPTVTRGGVKYPTSKLDRDIAATISGADRDGVIAATIDVAESDAVASGREIRIMSPRQSGKTKLVDDLANKRHVHKPAQLVASEHVAGALMETWACECGTQLAPRKAK